MGTPFTWRCPFCGHHATIGEANVTKASGTFTDNNKYGTQRVLWSAISCPNPACREYALQVSVHDLGPPRIGGQPQSLKLRHEWQLVPAAEMQVLPDYVPEPIVADYKEACLIATLSPKASATLSRRCLQGMIRDFWGVRKDRLIDEIKAIKEKVDGLTWDAIDAVRNIGNIGAHMEKDINVIVDVDPNEAKLLIGLIETLIEEWYVARYDRQQRFSKLVATAQDKKDAKTPAKGGDLGPDQPPHDVGGSLV